ncbi:hypothetical protein RF55_12860 [Lasius niger]|uniref:Peptidase aspartic putative domain-containing protein n=1 Tax=Lasius niger TaxID=67767 RepID=A0A0J7KBN8_LASNI|nr:hypothetical protein RF55_12860 [Lasius niger]
MLKANRKSPKTGDTVGHSSTVTNATILHEDGSRQVWLSTAIIQVLDVDGRAHPYRALLDPGSQSNLITEALTKKLRLPRRTANVPIIGVNQVMSLARDILKIKDEHPAKSKTSGPKFSHIRRDRHAYRGYRFLGEFVCGTNQGHVWTPGPSENSLWLDIGWINRNDDTKSIGDTLYSHHKPTA